MKVIIASIIAFICALSSTASVVLAQEKEYLRHNIIPRSLQGGGGGGGGRRGRLTSLEDRMDALEAQLLCLQNTTAAFEVSKDGDLFKTTTDCEGNVQVENLGSVVGPQGAPGNDGTNGTDGTDGVNCWDLDGDGVCTDLEDVNSDGRCTILDCQGPAGDQGAEGPQGDVGPEGNCSCSDDDHDDSSENVHDDSSEDDRR